MNVKRLHPDAIELFATECCVFNNLQSNIEEIKNTHAKKITQKWVNSFLGIFKNTPHLAFIPSKSHCEFYTEIASQELETLKDYSYPILICGHKKEDHIQALQSIMEKFNPEIERNGGMH